MQRDILRLHAEIATKNRQIQNVHTAIVVEICLGKKTRHLKAGRKQRRVVHIDDAIRVNIAIYQRQWRQCYRLGVDHQPEAQRQVMGSADTHPIDSRWQMNCERLTARAAHLVYQAAAIFNPDLHLWQSGAGLNTTCDWDMVRLHGHIVPACVVVVCGWHFAGFRWGSFCRKLWRWIGRQLR